MFTGERVLRGLRPEGVRRFELFERSGLLSALIERGSVVGTRNADCSLGPDYPRVLEHERVPVVSYPYEWTFGQLRAAALLHLDIQLEALRWNFALIDASAYNIQFVGARPVFIDVLSFRPYVDGELWAAHRQFCEQFLNPLLLRAVLGVPFNAWYRGSPEGIDTTALAALLPWRLRASPRCQAHLFLPARAQAAIRPGRAQPEGLARIRAARMPREGFAFLLRQLRDWIAGLTPLARKTLWQDYGREHGYAADEFASKRAFVQAFATAARPARVLDLGCNDGEFLALALAAGAGYAIGLDCDHGALERAWMRARDGRLDLLILYQDLADPSPGQGWRHAERQPLDERARVDAVLALALVHHLALGRNLPIDEVVDTIVSHAPTGVIEFVPKSDAMAQRLLALKGDLFADYGVDAFERAIQRRARIVRRETVSGSGRVLFWFDRSMVGGRG